MALRGHFFVRRVQLPWRCVRSFGRGLWKGETMTHPVDLKFRKRAAPFTIASATQGGSDRIRLRRPDSVVAALSGRRMAAGAPFAV